MADPYDENQIDSALGFWEGLHPGVRSAVIMWVVLIGIGLLNSVTGGTSIVFCYPVQLFLYAANGALGAYFALGSGYDPSDLPQVGAIAGLVGWILPALFYLVFGLILGLVTFGFGFVGVAAWLICGPVDLAIHATCGALGAWLYGRFGGSAAAVPYDPDDPYR